MNGGVARVAEGITSTSRHPVIDELDNDSVSIFISKINEFKQAFWNEFIANKNSQSADVIDEYIQLLNTMYNCLIKNTNCRPLPYQSFNTNNSLLSTLMNTINRIESEYWLKRTLIQFPFTFNMNKILDNN
jgi:hypothetical protein